ncbi:GntR family transcriptional regulator [Streptomyces zaomyceticus]|uniref:GntR family transcriptional regulator n=1 Tax=Streptomyces zaomyceticus TaxID=68286 RepID=UPI00378F30BC
MSGYSKIAAHYREVIRNGDLKPGDPMPSYSAAVAEHQVNRTTVIRAYDVLKSEGLIVSQPGKGTVVASSPLVVTGADRVNRMSQNGRQYAPGETSTGHRVMRRSVYDPEVCQALQLEPGDEVVIRIRAFRQDDRATTVGVSIYPTRTVAEVPELADEGRMSGGFFGTLYTERTGREVVRGQRTAEARQASQDELAALEIDAPPHVSVAVMVTKVTYHDEQGPLAHWEDVYAPGTRLPLPE